MPSNILKNKLRGKKITNTTDPDNEMPVFHQPVKVWQASAFDFAVQPYNTPPHLSQLAQCLAG